MLKIHFKISIVLMSLLFFTSNCASVNYCGKTFEPTIQIDIYFSKEEIEKEYIIIGHAVGYGHLFVTNDKIKNKLIKKAKANGADAILITGIDKSNYLVDDFSINEEKIIASFLKYK